MTPNERKLADLTRRLKVEKLTTAEKNRLIDQKWGVQNAVEAERKHAALMARLKIRK